jgi:hypothetical protein
MQLRQACCRLPEVLRISLLQLWIITNKLRGVMMRSGTKWWLPLRRVVLLACRSRVRLC